jgi:hypothetical protein
MRPCGDHGSAALRALISDNANIGNLKRLGILAEARRDKRRRQRRLRPAAMLRA